MKDKTRVRTSHKNIAAIARSVEENPGSSISRISLELGILQTLLHRTLHKDLVLKAYKVQFTQELKPVLHHHHRINNVVSLLIGSLKRKKLTQNVIEKSSLLMWPIHLDD